MTVFEDQYREMQRSGIAVGAFSEELTDTYGFAVEESFNILAASKSSAEALIGCITLIRACCGLMTAMGFTPEQQQEQWELIDVMAPAQVQDNALNLVEALMLNQGVPVVTRG